MVEAHDLEPFALIALDVEGTYRLDAIGTIGASAKNDEQRENKC